MVAFVALILVDGLAMSRPIAPTLMSRVWLWLFVVLDKEFGLCIGLSLLEVSLLALGLCLS